MSAGSSKCALVVDDCIVTRVILRRMLGELGYEVSEASNGWDAISLLNSRKNPVSLVLVDWNMPVMNGIEFVRKVRSQPRYVTTSLLMVTMETEIEQISEALDAGANEYIMKPLTKDVLMGKLRILGLDGEPLENHETER